MFMFNENDYCPGAVVGEGSEKASYFERQLEAFALICDTASHEEEKAGVEVERLKVLFQVGGIETLAGFRWPWVGLPHSGHD